MTALSRRTIGAIQAPPSLLDRADESRKYRSQKIINHITLYKQMPSINEVQRRARKSSAAHTARPPSPLDGNDRMFFSYVVCLVLDVSLS